MSRISFLQDLLSSVFSWQDTAAANDDSRGFEELCDALLSERGEVAGNRIASNILVRFSVSAETERLAFFQMLVTRFDVNAEVVQQAANTLLENNTPKNLASLLDKTEPRRQELFRRLNRVPGATGQLVNMRASLREHLRENPEFERIDNDFQKLFRSWFNRGFLVLREIDWRTPANVLEKLIEYEAVHAIRSWEALRRRLEPTDRKCFAFFHPAMPDEPLIFVEVALTQSLPVGIRDILSENREAISANKADTAVFYSISNCQKGLAGVSFGNFLIKQVATELSSQWDNLKVFRTLSPVPGMMRWVNNTIDHQENSELQGKMHIATRIASGDIALPNTDEQRMLQELAAHYLTKERRDDNQPLDPVARFHLGNGASLASILPVADVFKKGLEQSAGVMVSYLYDLDQVLENHERYASEQHVKTSDEVAALLGEKKRTIKRSIG